MLRRSHRRRHRVARARLVTPLAIAAVVVAAAARAPERVASADPPAGLRVDPSVVAAAACPTDARLVERAHYDKVEHTCTDGGGKRCAAFAPGEVRVEEPVRPIRVCMDVYEAPNRAGARPLVMKDAREAEAWCAARGKRLCREDEWEAACEGPDRLPYSYGWRSDPAVCNSGKPWRAFDEAALAAGGDRARAEVERLWQGEPSGARARCVSPEGIHDLLGNVEEWVTARPDRPFPVALKGGFWAKPWTTCRGTNDAHDGSFRFYEIGFRCCVDPR